MLSSAHLPLARRGVVVGVMVIICIKDPRRDSSPTSDAGFDKKRDRNAREGITQDGELDPSGTARPLCGPTNDAESRQPIPGRGRNKSFMAKPPTGSATTSFEERTVWDLRKVSGVTLETAELTLKSSGQVVGETLRGKMSRSSA